MTITCVVMLCNYIVPEFQWVFNEADERQLLNTLCGCEHEFASHIIRSQIDTLGQRGWRNLCKNPAEWVRELLLQNTDKILWYWLCSNPAEWAGQMCANNIKLVDISALCTNTGDWAQSMLKDLPPSMLNPTQLLQHQDEWVRSYIHNCNGYVDCIALNRHEWAHQYIEQNIANIPFDSLAQNPADWARQILLNNQEKIIGRVLVKLAQNPSTWWHSLLADKMQPGTDLFDSIKNKLEENPSIFYDPTYYLK